MAGPGFAALTPAQRELAAARGSLTRWSRVNSPEARQAATAKARETRRRNLEAQADPDGTLSPAERAAAADRLQRAHMAGLALASARRRTASAA